MGILDDLKKEAEALEAERARETTARQRALNDAQARFEPLMQRAYRYFNELKQHLDIVKKQVVVDYDFRDVGRVEGLEQSQYGVSTERPERIQRFTFRFVCAKSGAFEVNQRDAGAVAAYRDYLRDNGLKAKVRDTGRGAALFIVEPVVPVVIEFIADYERNAVRIRLRNVKSIGVTRYTVPPEKFDEKLLDELAKMVLRTPNRFDELTGNALSETGKVRIKKQLQEQLRRKEIEDQAARSEKTESITQRFGRSLFGRKE